jgi:NAD(P)-dependent dehydrogenase (short-subunit alcohol dehydrogenase family)
MYARVRRLDIKTNQLGETAMQLKGKRIIVCGGSSGIGAATVRAYVREGASVVSLGRNDERGRAVVKEAAKLGPGTVDYMHCDIGEQDEVNAVFANAITRLGGLDVLANPAGIDRQCNAEDIPKSQIDLMFKIHVYGTIFTNQAAFKPIRDAGGGSIINYSSLGANRGVVRMADYAAAKSAILGWTRSVAKEWGRYWIRVNAVCPSIRTPMADHWESQATQAQKAAQLRWDAENIYLGGKQGDADKHCAPPMVFLASDASSFITGQILSVDGGSMMVT